eukprot:61712-Prymnesium_polylepis.1
MPTTLVSRGVRCRATRRMGPLTFDHLVVHVLAEAWSCALSALGVLVILRSDVDVRRHTNRELRPPARRMSREGSLICRCRGPCGNPNGKRESDVVSPMTNQRFVPPAP